MPGEGTAGAPSGSGPHAADERAGATPAEAEGVLGAGANAPSATVEAARIVAAAMEWAGALKATAAAAAAAERRRGNLFAAMISGAAMIVAAVVLGVTLGNAAVSSVSNVDVGLRPGCRKKRIRWQLWRKRKQRGS
ncbi:hypothetical protein ABPG75_006589 [Micractinium tetrahymenae]